MRVRSVTRSGQTEGPRAPNLGRLIALITAVRPVAQLSFINLSFGRTHPMSQDDYGTDKGNDA